MRIARGLGRAAAALALLAAGCAEAPRGPRCPEAEAWVGGAVRWLLLPEERVELTQLRSCTAFRGFRDRFWQRRDPTPQDIDNTGFASYLERVNMADRLYGERNVPGSMTPRGRALIVLGSPSRLRTAHRPRPGPPETNPPAGRRAGEEAIETWAYTLADLPPRLQEAMGPPDANGEWRLVFAVHGDAASWLSGEDHLAAAARGWLRP